MTCRTVRIARAYVGPVWLALVAQTLISALELRGFTVPGYRCRLDGQVQTSTLGDRRFSKLLTLARQFWYLPVHFVWEMLPVAEFVTDFVRSNPDVQILVPDGPAVEMFLHQLWHDIDWSRIVLVPFLRCVRHSSSC